MSEPIQRVRAICLALAGATEKISHGEPTFFVAKKVFAMFSNNHHNDGHIAIWIPVPEGEQKRMIDAEPEKFYRPPYVGVKGWVGVEIKEVDDDELGSLLTQAWQLIGRKKSVR